MGLHLDYPVADARLDNGLRVLVNPDPGSPAVAVNLWYRVGSGDEPTGTKGFAHLFEHLMFEGSAQVRASEHLALMQSVGGTANATTSFDRTNYFETVPGHALELALWAEADRLSSLLIDQERLDNQREVVKEEKRQRYDNVPYGDQLRLLLRLAFPVGHPYAHPTIGTDADLGAARLDQVIAFHQQWYRPSNTVLTVAGCCQPDQVLDLVHKHFGAIGESPPAPVRPVTAALPALRGVPRRVVARDVPRELVHLLWRTPGLTDPRHPAVLATLAVLSTGQASRLHRVLVRGGLAEGVGAADFGLAAATSLSVLSARPREGVSPTRLEEAVLAELSTLAAHGPDPAELDRVVAQTEREWLEALGHVTERADLIGEFATLFGDPALLTGWLDRLTAVSAEQIAETAGTLLHPDARAVLEYHRSPDAPVTGADDD